MLSIRILEVSKNVTFMFLIGKEGNLISHGGGINGT